MTLLERLLRRTPPAPPRQVHVPQTVTLPRTALAPVAERDRCWRDDDTAPGGTCRAPAGNPTGLCDRHTDHLRRNTP